MQFVLGIHYRLILPAIVTGLLVACTEDKPADTAVDSTDKSANATAPSTESRRFSMERITQGAAIFQANCAECHGPDAQGHPDWHAALQEKRPLLVAPPLDGTGYTWKRSRAELAAIIRKGVMRDGKPVMPGWQDRLSETEVDSTISWFQALWPAEVYRKWEKAQTDRAAGKSG